MVAEVPARKPVAVVQAAIAQVAQVVQAAVVQAATLVLPVAAVAACKQLVAGEGTAQLAEPGAQMPMVAVAAPLKLDAVVVQVLLEAPSLALWQASAPLPLVELGQRCQAPSQLESSAQQAAMPQLAPASAQYHCQAVEQGMSPAGSSPWPQAGG